MKLNGRKKQELTKETMLSLVKDYDIYRYYFGEFKMNQVHVNHLRGEKTPSLIIGNKFGEITHKDMGNYYWRGNCFSLVQQIYGCDFYTALKHIDNDLNLGISFSKVKNVNKITWKTPKNIEIPKPSPIIQFTYRKPTNQELDYWNNYHLSLDDLKKENVYFPKSIYRNKVKLPLGDLLTFIYFYPDINKVKIYRPFAPKRIKETPAFQWKWDNSGIPFDYCEGLENIQNCNISLLTKSKKDKMVLKKLITSCVADVQAEDPSCINDVTINHLKKHSNTQVTVFDNDKKGKESSQWLTDTHNFKHCNVPDNYNAEGITDFADLCKNYGPERVIQHFKNKQLI